MLMLVLVLVLVESSTRGRGPDQVRDRGILAPPPDPSATIPPAILGCCGNVVRGNHNVLRRLL
jgi:hypothetical protein